MNFIPVTGAGLRDYDDETIKMFTKRTSDERLTTRPLQLDRRCDRNNLPVIASNPTQFQ